MTSPDKTSALAAAEQSPQRNRATAEAVLDVLRKHGPLTDDQIWTHYVQAIGDGAGYPTASPQSVRTRRHEVTVIGLVVKAGRGKSRYGRPSTTWALAATQPRA